MFGTTLLLAACGGGGGDSNSLNASAMAQGEFARNAYVAHGADGNSITAYAIDGTTDGLILQSTVPAPFEGSIYPDLVPHPAADYLYAYAPLRDKVARYKIATDGQLLLPAAELQTPNLIGGLTLSHDGSYVYISNIDNSTIDEYLTLSDGSISPVPASTVQTGARPDKLIITRNSEYAYVLNRDDDTISQYSVSDDGELMPLDEATVETGSGHRYLTIHPGGRYLYSSSNEHAPYNQDLNLTYQFRIGEDGALKPIASTPTATKCTISDERSSYREIVFSPSGNYAYAICEWSVFHYVVGTDGGLRLRNDATPYPLFNSETNESPISDRPVSLAIDPRSERAYVTFTHPSAIRQFKIEANGDLTASLPFMISATDMQARKIIVLGGEAPVLKEPVYAYVLNKNDGTVSQYAIGENGELTALTSPSVATGTTPSQMAMDPQQSFLYVANTGSNSISKLQISSSGELVTAATSPFSAGSMPTTITVGPNGRELYIANAGDEEVQIASINGDTLSEFGKARATIAGAPHAIYITSRSARLHS